MVPLNSGKFIPGLRDPLQIAEGRLGDDQVTVLEQEFFDGGELPVKELMFWA